MAAPIMITTSPKMEQDPEVEGLISITPFNGHSLAVIMEAIRSTWKKVLKGAPAGDLHSPLEMKGFDDVQRGIVIDIARTRKRASEKYPDGRDLFFTSEGLRWATPGPAADHCARRLGRRLVMDVTCGQGGQVLSLSRTSERVVAVDIDPMNCLVTLMNCLSRGVGNVSIVNADCFDPYVISLSDEGCGVFSDPARPPGSEERSFDEIFPDPRKVMEAYGGTSSGMCFEVPPYLSMDKVDFICEAEYVSLDGRLNRLNLYTGDLMRSERSAIVLPLGAELRGEPRSGPEKVPPLVKEAKYAYELDPAVVRSGLTASLCAGIGVENSPAHLDERRSLLLTDGAVDSPFLKQGYRVLRTSVDPDSLKEALVELGAGSVTLRYQMEPGDYWDVRKDLEEGLSGRRKVQLFRYDGYLILEKLEDRSNE
ncbi:MAG: hypothetical protein ACMUHU_04055 [Thermoplasmatota archaeon]